MEKTKQNENSLSKWIILLWT